MAAVAPKENTANKEYHHHHHHQQHHHHHHPQPSQSSSSIGYITPEPISGLALFEAETQRRDILWDQGNGNFSTGCRELDESVLVGGGFERGCVVGVSAEDGGGGGGEGAVGGRKGNQGYGPGDGVADAGLYLGMQTLARCLLKGLIDGDDGLNRGANDPWKEESKHKNNNDDEKKKGREKKKKRKAMIITTGTVAAIVNTLMAVLKAQITDFRRDGGTKEERQQILKDCLERVAISRVFDVPGLWEVLGELDRLPPSQELGEQKEAEAEKVQQRSPAKGGEGVSILEDTIMIEPSTGNDEQERDMALDSQPTFTPREHVEQDATVDESGNGELKETSGQYEQENPFKPLAKPSSEIPSSPLSSPPSSLSDTIPPWDITTETITAQQVASSPPHHQRTTPPGLRDEIQDSEDEDVGLSSPPDSIGSSPWLQLQFDEPIGQMTMEAERPPQSTVQRLEDPDEIALSQSKTKSDQNDTMNTTLEDFKAPPSIPAHDSSSREPNLPAADNRATSCGGGGGGGESEEETAVPDIILITHMSTLLSSLFHQREKETAHHMLQLLSAHIRYLSRSPEHGCPLIMILNSTTSTASNNQDDSSSTGAGAGAPGSTKANKLLDPTLRSIFNPLPLQASRLGGVYEYNYRNNTPSSYHFRRNKPSFGLIFSQMLDMHLLCTRIPKTQADAEALYAPLTGTTGGGGKRVKYAWVVEVLLDEIGIWTGRESVVEGRPRIFREQRWGAVEFKQDGAGLRVVDAFDKRG